MSTEIMTAPSPALSLIVSLDEAIKADNQLKAIVKKAMKPGTDYGIIPHTGDKPTLLKPGMEKLLMWYGLQLELPENRLAITDTEDYVSATVVAVIRHRRSGYVIAEGIGSANSGESRFQGRNRSPRGMANTILKMAKKRAGMDATLTATASSGLFTADLEDGLGDIEDAPTNGHTTSQPNNATTSQHNNVITDTDATRSKAEAIYRKWLDKADALEIPADSFDPDWPTVEIIDRNRKLRAKIAEKEAGIRVKAEEPF